ncbi:hypothetical protein K0U27_01720 [archaeon]|nr:hypothetical protein [archaeon]
MTDDRKENRENIFEILDAIMFQLSKTKKMFLIMILTVLIIPPAALLVMSSVVESPFEEQLEKRLQDRLDRGGITQDEFDNIKMKFGGDKPSKIIHPPQLIIIIISVAWLGIGIRQWIVLSRWDKKYRIFKAKQKEIDKKFEDDSDE